MGYEMMYYKDYDSEKIDDELFNLVIVNLFNEGDYLSFELRNFLLEGGVTFSQRDYYMFCEKFKKTKFISFRPYYEELGHTDIISLTDFGITNIKKHKSYEKYLIQKNKDDILEKKKSDKKEKAETAENWKKRNWLWIAVFSGLGGISGTLIVLYSTHLMQEYWTKSEPQIQAVQDTLLKHKYDSLILYISSIDTLRTK